MKQVVLIFGVCMLTTVGFSQQAVTSERNGTVIPVNQGTEEVLQTTAADSVMILHSMARDGKATVIPVSKETESNSAKQPGTKAVSSAKKPD